MDPADGDRIQIVEATPPDFARDHEACLFEDVDVLHHPEPGHLGVREQVTQRATVLFEQEVQELAPCRVGKGPKDPVVLHRPENT
jgi:hypothetical protein